MREFYEAVAAGASGDEIQSIPLPEAFKAAYVHSDDMAMFDGLPPEDRDPRQSLRVGEVEMPELAPDECLIAVMASCINHNTVWSSIFSPMPTHMFLQRYAGEGGWAARHLRPEHILGSDASGVVVRCGSAVQRWKPGDRVVVTPNHVSAEDEMAHQDAMLAQSQRAWGFETNFGGLGEACVAKASQLLPMPTHLTWEEAAVNALCLGTSYRMLNSRNGANMKIGDVVLIWGATGGIGIYAVQLVQAAGGIPVCVVSSEKRAALLRKMGVEHVINRRAEDFRFWSDPTTQDESEWRRFGKAVMRETGGDLPDIVFEHPGRETMGASVFVAKRGGTIVTCAATSGYMLEYDNRHLWMRLKKIISSHGANLREQSEANRLLDRGIVQPCLTGTYTLDETARAAAEVHHNLHEGKLAVLCLAPAVGLGVEDPAKRERIGEDKIHFMRRALDEVEAEREARSIADLNTAAAAAAAAERVERPQHPLAVGVA